MEYRTVYQGGKGEIVEKKVPVYRGSIFGALGGGSHAYLEQIRKKYWDARHHCWAYVIGEERVTERCSMMGNRAVQQANRFWRSSGERDFTIFL